MSICDALSIRVVKDGNVYIDGTLRGLDASKEYSLKYAKGGRWVNLPNARQQYTYIIKTTYIDVGGWLGGYFPLDPKYTSYSLALFEVKGTCENVVKRVCSKYLSANYVKPKPPKPPIPWVPPSGEHAVITDVKYPLSAKAGEDVEVIVTAFNSGAETCELRAVLRNYERKKIDTMPEERLKLYTSVKPGASKDFRLSTSHAVYGSRWKMPEYDWDLEVEIAEIDKNWGSVQKVQDSRRIAVQLYRKGEEYEEEDPWEDDDPHRGEDDDPYLDDDDDVRPTGDSTLSLDAPAVMVSGKTTVTGVAPSSNTKVEIMGVRKFIGFDMLSRDTTLATTMSDAEGNYSVPIELGEFGVVDVYAKIRRDWKPPGWLGSIIPPIDWLARDTTSAKQTIFVLTYTILFALLAMVVMVADKKYGFIGIFGKKGGKK